MPRKYVKWSPEMLETLRAKYPVMNTAELADELGVSVYSVHNQADKLGYRKVKGFNANTQFTAGHSPVNTSPVGTERIGRDGYIEVKVSDDRSVPAKHRWKLKHHLIWIEHNGEIPHGMSVGFIDNDRANLAADNLRLMTPQEQGAIASMRVTEMYPPELRSLLGMRGALTRKIKQKLEELQ